MNRYQTVIVGLLALSGVLVFMTLRPSTQTVRSAEAEAEVASEQKRPPALEQAALKAGQTREPAATKKGVRAPLQKMAAEAPGAAAAPGAAEQTAAEEAQTVRERSVAAWEALVDQVIGEKDVPVAEQAQRVKAAFDKLDKADQMDGIHRSLNLFQDEQFPALYAILYDKTENPEVLDAIFSDALNRPEEIKMPLMKELRKDRAHPMFFESARILDVVESTDETETPAPTPSP